ncbi:hypothetical protein [Vibrio sp. Vb339]|nr:hypothetical protein [Vibrio sp. Vb339]
MDQHKYHMSNELGLRDRRCIDIVVLNVEEKVKFEPITGKDMFIR